MLPAELVPLIRLKRERPSIRLIASMIIDFYRRLAQSDPRFGQIEVLSEKKTLHPSIDVNTENAKTFLAEELLHRNKKDIRKRDKLENPTLDDVLNKSIISIGLEVIHQGVPLMTLSFNFLDSDYLQPSIGSIVTHPTCLDTFEKAKVYLDTVNEFFSVDHSVIKVFDNDINEIVRGYKAPLGWITYFANDYELPIPNDLVGIEYEYTDEGRYLILTRENPIAPDVLDANKEKLIKLMAEIKDRVPEYAK